MAISLIPEEEMTSMSKKSTNVRPVQKASNIPIITKDTIVEKKEGKDDRKDNAGNNVVVNIKDNTVPNIAPKTDAISITDKRIMKTDVKVNEIKTGVKTGLSIIVKKLYFPNDTYSNNEKEFKKILAASGLIWFKPMFRTYINKDGKKILTGMYVSSDQGKKVFAIYEGSKKPATMIIKIVGTGGKFLLDLTQFCHKIGCTLEDKDEIYSNNVMLRLHEYGDINVQEVKSFDKMSPEEKKIFLDKLKISMLKDVDRYIEHNKDALIRRGINLDVVKIFKIKDFEKDAIWLAEHGFLDV